MVLSCRPACLQVNMGEQLASKEEEQIAKKEDLAGAKEDEEELAAYLADLHKSCDFVLKNFDLRQEAPPPRERDRHEHRRTLGSQFDLKLFEPNAV